MLSAAQRQLRGRIGALTLHAQGKTNTAPGTRAFLDRFEREVDPQASLPAAVRARRAKMAATAHMLGLALTSSRVRAIRKQTKTTAPVVENPGAVAEGTGDAPTTF